MNKNRIIYFCVLVIAAILAICLELVPVLDGILPSATPLEFGCEYISIAATLILVYLALRLIKHNILLRIAMLGVPMIANILLYHAFIDSRFGYLAIVCLISFAFVYPPKEENE